MYLSMDNPHVQLHSLYDLGQKLVSEGYSSLLMDEAHHYKNWKTDTKALYDEFPGLTIIVSGSAPLAFEPERRYEIIEVEPLSILEFSELKGDSIDVQDKEAWRSVDKTLEIIAANPKIYEVFNAYMDGGAFPTFFPMPIKRLIASTIAFKSLFPRTRFFFQMWMETLYFRWGAPWFFSQPPGSGSSV